MAGLAGDGSAGREAPKETLRVTILNRLGLHARPAALLVRAASGFDADVIRRRRDQRTRARERPQPERRRHPRRSPGRRPRRDRHGAAGRRGPRRASLAWPKRGSASRRTWARRSQTRRRPSGWTAGRPRAHQTLRHRRPARSSPASRRRRARRSDRRGDSDASAVPIPDVPAGEPSAEWDALSAALEATAADVLRARASLAGVARARDAAIFDAHLLFLEDEALLAPARVGIFDRGESAARAWHAAVAAAAQSLGRTRGPLPASPGGRPAQRRRPGARPPARREPHDEHHRPGRRDRAGPQPGAGRGARPLRGRGSRLRVRRPHVARRHPRPRARPAGRRRRGRRAPGGGRRHAPRRRRRRRDRDRGARARRSSGGGPAAAGARAARPPRPGPQPARRRSRATA